MNRLKEAPPKPLANAATPEAALLHPTTAATQAPASKGKAVEEHRRGQRVLLGVRAQVHVALGGTPTTFEVTTFSVNSHGALITLQQNLPANTRLVLEHEGTKEGMSCRVVRAP
jgi:hypothetical protein